MTRTEAIARAKKHIGYAVDFIVQAGDPPDDSILRAAKGNLRIAQNLLGDVGLRPEDPEAKEAYHEIDCLEGVIRRVASG